MSDVYILSGVRCASGRANRGILRYTRPDDLIAFLVNTLIDRTKINPEEVDDFRLGNAMPEASQGLNVARIAQFMTKLPHSVPAVTVNRFCASGLEAITTACYQIASGDADLIVAGGVESMTMVPMGGYTPRPNPKLADEFIDAYIPMGITAENVAEKFNVSREDQDEFAYHSHMKAEAATNEGRFKDEVIPLEITMNGKKIIHEKDETIRPDTTLERLATLRPAFKVGGTVTAGNSSPLTDEGALVLVASKKKKEELGLQPLLRFVCSASVGVDPALMGIGPAFAIPKVLKISGLKMDDIDLIELNEAFASQSVAVVREIKADPAKVNVNGGAIALGHALGCSGARLTTTLTYEMKRRKAKYGIVSMCIGGGQGMAAIFEGV